MSHPPFIEGEMVYTPKGYKKVISCYLYEEPDHWKILVVHGKEKCSQYLHDEYIEGEGFYRYDKVWYEDKVIAISAHKCSRKNPDHNPNQLELSL